MSSFYKLFMNHMNFSNFPHVFFALLPMNHNIYYTYGEESHACMEIVRLMKYPFGFDTGVGLIRSDERILPKMLSFDMYASPRQT